MLRGKCKLYCLLPNRLNLPDLALLRVPPLRTTYLLITLRELKQQISLRAAQLMLLPRHRQPMQATLRAVSETKFRPISQ